MTALHILAQWDEENMDRIAAHAQSLAGDHPEIVEAAERVRTVRGPDEIHTRTFRLGAIADLMECVDRITAGPIADPLDNKNVPELREIAKAEGIGRPQDYRRKRELIDAIKAKRQSEDEDGEG